MDIRVRPPCIWRRPAATIENSQFVKCSKPHRPTALGAVFPALETARFSIRSAAVVAYLFAITVLLPRVPYVTRMDRFILLSTFLVFAGLIQTVANSVIMRRRKKELVERVDRWSRAVYPLLLVFVLVFSFSI